MKKYLSGIIVLALIAIVSAFTINTKNNTHNNHREVTSTVWFYNGTGTTEADLQNGNNWDQTNGSPCVTSGNRPCQITADASTQAELTDYLSAFDKSQILAMSSGRKP